jgi:hypothetical protein
MTTVRIKEERAYSALHHDDWKRWWAWLTEVLDNDPSDMRIVRVTLGEGQVEIERYEMPLRQVGEEMAMIIETYPAPVPPPCWPPVL